MLTKGMITGTFDLFHAGHVRLLKESRKQVDELYIGVNQDARVKMKKGNLRPLFPLQERLEILHACEYVTEVMPIPYTSHIDGDSSERGIRMLIDRWSPDVWFDGAQQSAAKHAIPLSKEYRLEYRVLNCELVHTTQIIKKILKYEEKL